MDDEPLDFDALPDDSGGPVEDGFKCPECDKSVPTQRGLNIHLSRMHDIGPQKADAKPASATARRTNLERELVNFFQFIGLAVSAANAKDGQIVFANADQLAKAWSNLAKNNKKVEKALLSLMQTSAFGEVFMAMAAVAIPIMANHDMLPGGLGAAFTPNTEE